MIKSQMGLERNNKIDDNRNRNRKNTKQLLPQKKKLEARQ